MKIGFVSLGCPKNLVDAEVMLGLAEQAGHEITPEAETAEVLVVNTCAFIDRAKQESIDTILEMAELKKQAVGRRLVVTGCLAERYRDELKREIPEIDAVLGTGEVPAILEAIEAGKPGNHAPTRPLTFYKRDPKSSHERDARVLPEGSRQRIGSSSHSESSPRSGSSPIFGVDLPTYIYDADTPRRLATPGHYAYVKIAEGCDYKCAFCIIPKMRGHYRSRPVESIVTEARALAGRGVKEILLISQDTSFFGNDRKERGALPHLLRELNQVSGLEWIRLLYLYPTTISDELVAAIAECDKVCKYIDLPLQHASDSVLRWMKRPGTRAGYEKLLAGLRARIPGVALRTTFIVGFPGETDHDFEQLLEFVAAVEFDHVGVFTYSHEEGTTAHDLADDVPLRVKERRRDALMARQKELVARRNQGRIGERVRLVVEGPSEEHELVLRGRISAQAPEIDPIVYLTDCNPSEFLSGRFIDVEIVGAREYDLVARPL